MALVIVTKNQYLIASKIHHIVLHEQVEHHDIRKNGKITTIVDFSYQINITYTPDSNGGNGTSTLGGRDERYECMVQIKGKVDAYKVYKSLIEQIREQMPDELFLAKAMESLLSDDDFKVIDEDEDRFEKIKRLRRELERLDDASAKKVRRVRKAKRNR